MPMPHAIAPANGTDGPRVAAMELGGWDTHAAQAQRLFKLRLRVIGQQHRAETDGVQQAAANFLARVHHRIYVRPRRARRRSGSHDGYKDSDRGEPHYFCFAFFLVASALARSSIAQDW